MDKQEKIDQTTVALKLKLDELINYFEGRDTVQLTPYLLTTLREFVDHLNEFKSLIVGPLFPLGDGTYVIMSSITDAIWGRRRMSLSFICTHLNRYIEAFNKAFNMQIATVNDPSRIVKLQK